MDLPDTGRLYQAKMVGQQDQQKQRDGKTYPEGQCLDRAIAFSLVFHQINQGRPQAEQDKEKSDGDKNFHTRLLLMLLIDRLLHCNTLIPECLFPSASD
jgi:hypothetical protein